MENDQRTRALHCKTCNERWELTEGEIKQGFIVVIRQGAQTIPVDANYFICEDCQTLESVK